MTLIEGKNSRYCTKCNKLKTFDNFSPQKEAKYGYKPHCKECCAFQRKLRKEYGCVPKIYRIRYIKNEWLKETINASVCSKCKKLKKFSKFNKHSDKKDGLDSWCKTCTNTDKNRKQKAIQYYNKNLKKYPSRPWSFYKTCTECNKSKTIYKYSKSKYGKYGRLAKCKVCMRPKYNEYQKRRRNNDINYKIENYIRTRIWHVLSNEVKSSTAFKYLSCSMQELKKHLKDQFEEGMSWDNYGEWHLDHIIPCAAFDLSCEYQQAVCFHYTNLQPLWAEDNLNKRDAIPDLNIKINKKWIQKKRKIFV